MKKIKSYEELLAHRNRIQKDSKATDELNQRTDPVRVKLAMATCGIAAGACTIMDFLSQSLEKRGIDALVTKTGCMGYCYAEPTIEVTLPGEAPVVFGDVDLTRADQIIERYIKNSEIIEGVIPVNYRTIN